MKIRIRFKIPDIKLLYICRIKRIEIINTGNLYSGISPETMSLIRLLPIKPAPPVTKICIQLLNKTQNRKSCQMAGFSKYVGKTGFEPATPWSQTRCATGLRYFPILFPITIGIGSANIKAFCLTYSLLFNEMTNKINDRKNKSQPATKSKGWLLRRGWDSNPRYSLTRTTI